MATLSLPITRTLYYDARKVFDGRLPSRRVGPEEGFGMRLKLIVFMAVAVALSMFASTDRASFPAWSDMRNGLPGNRNQDVYRAPVFV